MVSKQSHRTTYDVHGVQWIDIQAPKKEELLALQKEYHFHPLDIEDVLKERQRPKIIEHPDYLFLEIHFPFFDRTKKRTHMVWIDFFVSRTHLITIHRQEIPILQQFMSEFDPVQVPSDSSHTAGMLMYKILSFLFYTNFPKLDKISEKIAGIESLLFEGHEYMVIQDLLYIKSDLISFRRIIRPQLSLFEPILKERSTFFPSDLQQRFRDIQHTLQQTWQTLENLYEAVSSLDATTHELLSHKVNSNMRILTYFTSMLFPLSVLLTLIRMDLPGNPFLGIPSMYWISIGLSLIFIFGGYFYFRRKDLL